MKQLSLDVLKTAAWGVPATSGRVDGEVLGELRDQAVAILAADAIKAYEVEETTEQQWTLLVAQQMRSFTEYMKEQTRLTELLTAHGLTPVILKGSSAAMYYREPWARRMGDIDFLVFPRGEESFEKAKQILTENEYVFLHDNGRHISLRHGKTVFEAHRFFSLGENDEDVKKDMVIDSSTPVEHKLTAWGTYSFYTLPDEINGIVFLEHIIHHLVSGLGLRQVLDWLFYVQAVVTDEFWNTKLKPAAEKTSLDALAKIVTRMGEIYLGAPERAWCSDADEEACRMLFEKITEDGNFGRSRNQKDNSMATVMNLGVSPRKLQQRGLKNWPAAQKHKILRPFAWCYQLGRYFKKGVLQRDRESAGFVSSYREHKKQEKLFRKLGIGRFKKM